MSVSALDQLTKRDAKLSAHQSVVRIATVSDVAKNALCTIACFVRHEYTHMAYGSSIVTPPTDNIRTTARRLYA